MLKKILRVIKLFFTYIFYWLFRKRKKNFIDVIENKDNKDIDITKVAHKDIAFVTYSDAGVKSIKNDIVEIEELVEEKKYEQALNKINTISKKLNNTVIEKNKKDRIEKIVNNVKEKVIIKKEESKNKDICVSNISKELKDDKGIKVNVLSDMSKNVPRVNIFKSYIVESTKIIKATKKELEKIKDDKNKYGDKEYIDKIKELNKRLKTIEKNYYYAKKSATYIEIVNINIDDPYDLKHDTILLNELINKLEKEMIIKPIEKVEKETIKEEKKIEIKEKKEDKVIYKAEVKQTDEHIISNNIIMENINKNLIIINGNTNSIGNIDDISKPRRKGILSTIMGNTLKFGISLFPFMLFRNKLLGLTTSFVLINNNMRMSRKVVTNVDIRLFNSCIDDIDYLINDTKDQIYALKTEIRINGYYDMDLEKKINRIEKYISRYEKTNQKNKAKVKKLEYRG